MTCLKGTSRVCHGAQNTMGAQEGLLGERMND